MKITIKQKKDESRKIYLVKVAMIFLEKSWELENSDLEIEYDNAICDKECLIEDLKNEFNIEEINNLKQ